MALSVVLPVSGGEIPSSGDSGFTRAVIARVKEMPLIFVMVGLKGIFQDEDLVIRPPPEPPPRRTCWVVVKKKTSFGVFFVYLFWLFYIWMYCFFSFNFGTFFHCKTLALRWRDKESAVTVIRSKLPKFGLASYTASLQVVSSQSRPRADGYLWFFSSSVLLLNATFMN
ncbi:unnamed protein product [Cuscuta epithymum]|uniref:Uncharacterized protein n=1 Tax=Cuscuta epithymum TaxID=186058 RepID=A0AAV0EHN6_9ASTE|nr:unnamed protein product [Cuscuta epithymum]